MRDVDSAQRLLAEHIEYGKAEHHGIIHDPKALKYLFRIIDDLIPSSIRAWASKLVHLQFYWAAVCWDKQHRTPKARC